MKNQTLYIIVLSMLLLVATAHAVERTGLTELTPEESRELHQKRVRSIYPNKAAIAKTNKERKRNSNGKNLPPIDIGKAREGDKETDTENTNGLQAITKKKLKSEINLDDLALPSLVDNTELPYFPSIISQQSLGSCVAFAAAYYQMSHETCLARGCNNKTNAEAVMSPRWTYNFIGNGLDEGSNFNFAYGLLTRVGAVKWSTFPYDGLDYLTWDLNPSHWAEAVSFRMNPVQYFDNIDTTEGLLKVKQALSNGHILTFGTYIRSWAFGPIKNNPITGDSSHQGESAVYLMRGSEGPHAMTIAGYDDELWIDINNNNLVDNNETGALLIVNSWGTNCGRNCGKNNGKIWISYDALKAVSAVEGAPTFSDRFGLVQKSTAYLSTAKQSYTPQIMAGISVKSATRGHLAFRLGYKNKNVSKFKYLLPFLVRGGELPIDHLASSLQYINFNFDVTDLVPKDFSETTYSIEFSDWFTGSPTYINENGLTLFKQKSGELIDNARNQAFSLDKKAKTLSITAKVRLSNQPPSSEFSYSKNGQQVTFNGNLSRDSDGSLKSYVWDFGDGSPRISGKKVTHTFSDKGTYRVTLSVSDNNNAVTLSSLDVAI